MQRGHAAAYALCFGPLECIKNVGHGCCKYLTRGAWQPGDVATQCAFKLHIGHGAGLAIDSQAARALEVAQALLQRFI